MESTAGVRLSVIIPVYNVEKHLRGCLDSILKNDCGEVEIILVNDGSSDSSPQICDEYSQKHSCVRTLHKENGGAADARNYGLDSACGEYVTFIDSDDYVDQGFLSEVLKRTENRERDIIVFSHFTDFIETGNFISSTLTPRDNLTPTEALREMEDTGALNLLWNKLYKKSITDSVRFELNTEPGEDLIFNCDCFKAAKTVEISEFAYYHWIRRGEDTLANRFRRDLIKRNFYFIEKRNDLYRALGMEKSDEALLSKGNLDYVFACVPNMYRAGKRFPRKERLAFYSDILKSDDVRRWVELSDSGDRLMKQFVGLYKNNSPKVMDLAYSAMMGTRNRFGGLWKKIRNSMKK